jgi:hypothetical protein
VTIKLQELNSTTVVHEFPMPRGWSALPDGIYFDNLFYSRIAVSNQRAIFRRGSVEKLTSAPAPAPVAAV